MNRNNASLTVEAAFVLPIFVYSIIAFLYFFNIMIVQENIQFAITETGRFIAKYSYINNDSLEKESNKELFVQSLNLELVKVKVKEIMNKNHMRLSFIVNNDAGLNFSRSSIMKNNGEIDIIVIYKIRLPILFLSIRDIPMVQRIKLRGWIGDDIDKYDGGNNIQDSTENIVYITQTGTVYHRTKKCTYLDLSVRKVYVHEIEELRNYSGGKYKACEVCASSDDSASNDVFYITNYGDRYHNSLVCSGLKRSIFAVSIDNVGNRTPCKKCYKGE